MVLAIGPPAAVEKEEITTEVRIWCVGNQTLEPFAQPLSLRQRRVVDHIHCTTSALVPYT